MKRRAAQFGLFVLGAAITFAPVFVVGPKILYFTVPLFAVQSLVIVYYTQLSDPDWEDAGSLADDERRVLREIILAGGLIESTSHLLSSETYGSPANTRNQEIVGRFESLGLITHTDRGIKIDKRGIRFVHLLKLVERKRGPGRARGRL